MKAEGRRQKAEGLMPPQAHDLALDTQASRQRLGVRRLSAFLRTSNAATATVSSLVALLALLAGCAVGPDYQRPALDTPATFRASATETADPSVTNSLADLDWWQVMDDPQLRLYIAEALTNSWDIRIAAARVLQAEAAARVTRSQLFPTVGAGADWATTRASEDGATTIPAGVNPQREFGSVYGAMASYEVDLWGRIRRANEAALAQLLATEAAHLMQKHAIQGLLVIDDAGSLVGALNFQDLLRAGVV